MSEWERTVKHSTGDIVQSINTSLHSIPDEVLKKMRETHIVYKAKIGCFRLGTLHTRLEKLWRQNGDGKLDVERVLGIRETAILDRQGKTIGHVMLPDPDNKA